MTKGNAKKKDVWGFVVGKPCKVQYIDDCQQLWVTVKLLSAVNPVQKLAEAAEYESKDVEYYAGKLRRCKQLGIKHYYRNKWCSSGEITFKLQGSISTNEYYSVGIECKAEQSNAAFLSKLLKDAYRIENAVSLVARLTACGAIEVSYDDSWCSDSGKHVVDRLGDYYALSEQSAELNAMLAVAPPKTTEVYSLAS